MPVRRRAPATTPRRPGSAHVCRCCARSRSSWSAPQDTGEHLIKRVIGTPGDHVVCCDAEGRVSVNGVSIDETYIKPGSIPSRDPFDRTVPEDMLFVMGDNRQNSADSRYSTGKPGGGFRADAQRRRDGVRQGLAAHPGLLRNPSGPRRSRSTTAWRSWLLVRERRVVRWPVRPSDREGRPAIRPQHDDERARQADRATDRRTCSTSVRSSSTVCSSP
ncbi:signal peptidase I [Cellulosimicrobium sp. E-16]|uniref:signal peptidase I n=1 Tax=Cellulosimicrobium sp. E-16 TaxID=3404049 RepID=UPI003CE7977D